MVKLNFSFFQATKEERAHAFRLWLKNYIESNKITQLQAALKMSVVPGTINHILNKRRVPTLDLMEKMTQAVGINHMDALDPYLIPPPEVPDTSDEYLNSEHNEKYQQEIDNEMRISNDFVSAPDPEGETVTISREEYEALKSAATRQGHEEPSLDHPPLYGPALADIQQLLMTIVSTTMGQIEATKQADMDIIKAIKQNKIEEYEKVLAHLRQDLKEKNLQIENIEKDHNRLKDRVEYKVDNMFTLVGGKKDDNGGDDNGGNGKGNGGEKVA